MSLQAQAADPKLFFSLLSRKRDIYHGYHHVYFLLAQQYCNTIGDVALYYVVPLIQKLAYHSQIFSVL